MEEQAKVAELATQASFMKKRQMAEFEAERLRVEEELARAKARMKVFHEVEEEKEEIPDETGRRYESTFNS